MAADLHFAVNMQTTRTFFNDSMFINALYTVIDSSQVHQTQTVKCAGHIH